VPPARIETASHVLVQMMMQRRGYISILSGSAASIYANFNAVATLTACA